jgi:hypothetical protein
VPFLLGRAIGRIDLDLRRLARFFHLRRKHSTWCEIKVVLGLKEEDRDARMADCTPMTALPTLGKYLARYADRMSWTVWVRSQTAFSSNSYACVAGLESCGSALMS